MPYSCGSSFLGTGFQAVSSKMLKQISRLQKILIFTLNLDCTKMKRVQIFAIAYMYHFLTIIGHGFCCLVGWLVLNLVQVFTGSLTLHFSATFPNSQDLFISPFKKWLQKKAQAFMFYKEMQE